jgi:hypothetical protein
MAYAKNALQELEDGELFLQVTPGRAQAMVAALDIALDSGELDKRIKGVVRAMRELLAPEASGQTLERNPSCSVYVVPDTGPNGEQLTKIGHALDVRRRFARNTDRPTPLSVLAWWRFASITEAMEREAAARQLYDPYEGDGGREWVKANAEKVVDDLTELFGKKPRWPRRAQHL